MKRNRTNARRMRRVITPEGIIGDIAIGTTHAALVALKKRLKEKAIQRAKKTKPDAPPF